MNYWHLIWQIPAIVSGTTIVAYLLPFKIKPHFIPLLTFLVGYLVLVLPVIPDMALAVTPLVAIIQKYLGISLTEHEPLKLPEAEKVKSAIVARVKPAKTQLQQFITRAYPNPSDEPAAPKDDDPPEHAPPDQREEIKSYIPRLE